MALFSAVALLLPMGSAAAVAPASVQTGTPAWKSSVLSAGGSFKNAATVTATYSVTVQLVRTAKAVKPACTAAANCNSAGTVLNSVTKAYSAAKSATINLTALTVNCPAQLTTTLYYWAWVKVADSSGKVVTALSSYITGKYC
ncbi:MAG: hypothetical protein NTZ03_06655 [Actinobacteria bacterium]|nr:hypothetical protein [Actinomycetota bacterium]